MLAAFTVYFEGPFWVGVEPSNPELLDFMLYRFADMRRSEASGASAGGASDDHRPHGAPVNPKRAIREARRSQEKPPSTKAQAALSAAREERKSERALISREERLAAAERRFELRSEKRKRRHLGH